MKSGFSFYFGAGGGQVNSMTVYQYSTENKYKVTLYFGGQRDWRRGALK